MIIQKRIFILCCNYNCIKNEIDKLMENNLKHVIVNVTNMEFFIDNIIYRFIYDANNNPHKLQGYKILDYKTCPHYQLSNKLKDQLNIMLI